MKGKSLKGGLGESSIKKCTKELLSTHVFINTIIMQTKLPSKSLTSVEKMNSIVSINIQFNICENGLKTYVLF